MVDVAEKNLIVYKTKEGKEPFQEWRKSLKDKESHSCSD
jgi:hypothetical protein